MRRSYWTAAWRGGLKLNWSFLMTFSSPVQGPVLRVWPTVKIWQIFRNDQNIRIWWNSYHTNKKEKKKAKRNLDQSHRSGFVFVQMNVYAVSNFKLCVCVHACVCVRGPLKPLLPRNPVNPFNETHCCEHTHTDLESIPHLPSCCHK